MYQMTSTPDIEISDDQYDMLEAYALRQRKGEVSLCKMEFSVSLKGYNVTVTFGLN